MTTSSNQKKAVRARMAQTGESYMEARRHVEAGDGRTVPRATPERFGWSIQQEAVDLVDPTPYEWVVCPDGATHGFVDHGVFHGVVQSPEDRKVRYWREIVESGDVEAALVGAYPVTVDRFTRRWSTWNQPIGSVRPSLVYPERTALYGGQQPEPDSYSQARAQARAEADRRWAQAETVYGDLVLDDGDVIDIEPGGFTRFGMIHGFVTADEPRATVLWSDVEKTVLAGGRLDRLVGMRVVAQVDDRSPAREVGSAIAEVTLDVSRDDED